MQGFFKVFAQGRGEGSKIRSYGLWGGGGEFKYASTFACKAYGSGWHAPSQNFDFWTFN